MLHTYKNLSFLETQSLLSSILCIAWVGLLVQPVVDVDALVLVLLYLINIRSWKGTSCVVIVLLKFEKYDSSQSGP